ncbi:MAG: hypothetical protein IPH12_17415 [Saprospirales bacterium]|nr:hypothetical protein [Saprospirales bacterium]MBK8920644.1 hypothetical protein [Saprospirales bacterium]
MKNALPLLLHKIPITPVLFVLGGILAIQANHCQDAKQDPPPLPAKTCEGKGTIIIDPTGRRTAGPLACAGICPDGKPCRPVQNAAGTREWCGCPGQAEPEECHLVKVKYPDGHWGFDCDDPCPQPQDMCTPQSVRQSETKIVVSCECLTPK